MRQKQSIYQNYHLLSDLLLTLSNHSLTEEPYLFINNIDNFLLEVELKFNQLKMAEASHFSSFRSALKIVKSADLKGKEKRRKIFSASHNALIQSQEVLNHLYQPIAEKVNESKEILQQMFGMVCHLPNFPQFQDDFSQYLGQIWQSFLAIEEFKQPIARLRQLLITTDITLLLAEVVELTNNQNE